MVTFFTRKINNLPPLFPVMVLPAIPIQEYARDKQMRKMAIDISQHHAPDASFYLQRFIPHEVDSTDSCDRTIKIPHRAHTMYSANYPRRRRRYRGPSLRAVRSAGPPMETNSPQASQRRHQPARRCARRAARRRTAVTYTVLHCAGRRLTAATGRDGIGSGAA